MREKGQISVAGFARNGPHGQGDHLNGSERHLADGGNQPPIMHGGICIGRSDLGHALCLLGRRYGDVYKHRYSSQTIRIDDVVPW